MKKIWDFFNSLKLTVYLVLAIVAVTIYGSMVIYLHPEIYGDMDQHLFLMWLFSMGIKTADHSWWFFLLVGLVVILGINTVVCTIERLPAVFMRYKNPLMNLRDIEMGGERGVEIALRHGGELSELLVKNRYRVFSGGDALYAEKNRWVPFLPYVVHLGVMMFLIAHLISGLTGYRNSGLYIFEGESAKSPAGDYQLRLDKVNVQYRPDGSLKSYGSILTAIKDSKIIKTGTVTANKPMFVEGGAVYQREFGQTAKGIYLSAAVKTTGFSGYVVIPKGADSVEIPGGYRVSIESFIPDAGVDERGEPFSRSDEIVSPAVMVTLYGPGGPRSSGWLFMKEPGQDSFKDDDVALKFSNIDVRPYSSFDVNRDPGAYLALIASALVMFGSVTTLYFRRERVWASLDPDGNRAQVVCTDDELYEALTRIA